MRTAAAGCEARPIGAVLYLYLCLIIIFSEMLLMFNFINFKIVQFFRGD
jgi:hypothetical protein